MLRGVVIPSRIRFRRYQTESQKLPGRRRLLKEDYMERLHDKHFHGTDLSGQTMAASQANEENTRKTRLYVPVMFASTFILFFLLLPGSIKFVIAAYLPGITSDVEKERETRKASHRDILTKMIPEKAEK